MDLVTLILACSLYADNSIPYAMLQTSQISNPRTITVANQRKTFKTDAAAAAYAQQQLDEGNSVNIGLLQLSSRQLKKASLPVKLIELLRPCRNVVVATDIMNHLQLACQAAAEYNPELDVQACMIDNYLGNFQTDASYTEQVLGYAEDHPFSAIAAKALSSTEDHNLSTLANHDNHH